MTTTTQQRTTPRWVVSFLAAMVSVLVAILVGNPSSASAAATAETRVGASAVVVEPFVGPPEHITAGQRLGNEPARVVGVVATGVAANTAETTADAALASGRTTGAAAELRAGGQVFTDVSTGGAPRVLNSTVQDALDAVPLSQRAPWHGACAEMGCLSQALNAGVDPAGGWIRAVAIGTSNPGHGLPKVICRSCAAVLDQFGVAR